MSVCIRCQVLEVSPHGQSRRGAVASDLLPWADPYIALLMRRLEERYDVETEDAECDPFRDESSPLRSYDEDRWPDDAWESDGAQPVPAEASHGWYPPVYGGWPLLDDLEPELDAPHGADWEEISDDSAL